MLIYYCIPLIIGIYLNAISSEYVKQRAIKLLKNPYTPLPDIIHYYTPHINLIIPDIFLLCSTMFALYNYKTLINVKKILLCLGICTICRAITLNLTIMPTCMSESKDKDKDNFYSRYFHSTHDLMFSGHTLFFIAISDLLSIMPIKIIGSILLIMSRQHYTIDVLVSWLVYYNVLHIINSNLF